MRAAAANGNGQGPSWLLAAQQLLQKVLGSQDEVSRQHRATHPMAAAAAGGARPFSKPVSATNTSRCIAQGPSGSAVITTTKTAKADANAPTEVKSDDYTEEMQAKMGTTLTYRHVHNLFSRGPPIHPCSPLFDDAVDAASIGSGPAAAQPTSCILSLNLCLSFLAVPLPAGTRMASTTTSSCQTSSWAAACRGQRMQTGWQQQGSPQSTACR